MLKSDHFNLAEFVKSDYAIRHEIDNSPDELIVENLQFLVTTVLDPIRSYMNVPIIVTSGYRCERLNTLIGGSQKSQHMQGLAADVQAVGRTPRQIYEMVRKMCKNNRLKQLDQCILEFNSWVHISASTSPRRHFLQCYKEAGKTQYYKDYFRKPA